MADKGVHRLTDRDRVNQLILLQVGPEACALAWDQLWAKVDVSQVRLHFHVWEDLSSKQYIVQRWYDYDYMYDN